MTKITEFFQVILLKTKTFTQIAFKDNLTTDNRGEYI